MRLAALVVLLVSLIVTYLETNTARDRVDKLTNLESGFRLDLEADPDSLSGYEYGARKLLAADRFDDLSWIINTQTALHEEKGRLRKIGYDNAPIGREVHWSSFYAWWIRLLASIEGLDSDLNDAMAIERAALYANIVLVSVVSILVFTVALRYWGSLAATISVAGFVSLLPFRDVFKYGIGDHHATAISFSMLSVLLLAVAVAKPSKEGGSVLWPALAGVAGALGLWVNAMSQVPVLAGIGLAFVVLSILGRLMPAGWSDAKLDRVLRAWSRAGAIASLVAYLIEYAPSDMSMRLEVNHPLFAMAWLAGGEGLCQLRRLLSRDSDDRGGFSLRLFIASSLGLCLFPLVVLIAGSSVYQVADSFLMAVHNGYIMEFQSLVENVAVLPSKARSFAMLLPAIAIPIAVGMLFRSDVDKPLRLALLFALGPAMTLFLATMFQARWWAHASAFLIPLLILIVASGIGLRVTSKKWWAVIGLWLCLLPGLAFTLTGAVVDKPISQRDRLRAVERGIAHYLRARQGTNAFTVLASPDASLNLVFYGGAKAIGTYYWENNEGLKRAAEIFATDSFEKAKSLIEEAGITHVVLYSWGGFEKDYVDLYREYMGEGQASEAAFVMRLVRDRVTPTWLRPIPFRVPEELGTQSNIALLYEVVDEMSPAEQVASTFEYYVEMGWPQPAFALESRLVQFEESLAAQISLARLYAISGRKAEFETTLQGVQSRLASQPDILLSLEERIRFAGIMAASGKKEVARQEMEVIMGSIDETAMRALYPDTLLQLIQLEEILMGDSRPSSYLRSAKKLLPKRHAERLK